MNPVLHITSGDHAATLLAQAGLPGEVFVWHDVLYDGPRNAGWPTEGTLEARAGFLEKMTGGALGKAEVLKTLQAQYQRLENASEKENLVLWFDACLFDQSMLTHILTCLDHSGAQAVELLCVDHFPGVDPYHGLGQLSPEQLASVYDQRRPVTDAQFDFAKRVDAAFARQDPDLFAALSREDNSKLPWVAAAVRRWLLETPDTENDLGRLERLALEAIQTGHEQPWEIFNAVAAADTPPQYWGDITLWAKINALANRIPPLVRIDGPASRLPQWTDQDLSGFRISPS